jgi:hypothetical protein
MSALVSTHPAKVYDSIAGKFVLATGQIDAAGHFMTETRLKDGTVLLAEATPTTIREPLELIILNWLAFQESELAVVFSLPFRTPNIRLVAATPPS